MRPWNPVLLLTLAALGGCATAPLPSVAHAPPNAFGVMADPDIAAINLAAWFFATPSRLQGHPAEAARALAALDYAAGSFATSLRWSGLPPLDRDNLVAARAKMRHALGIAPHAPSQAVVDGLLTAFDDLEAGNQAGARAALAAPVFPADMLAKLSHMPFLPSVNVATMTLANDLVGGLPSSGSGNL